mmetsp:Transcript_9195/g.19801  ORF Transcript_9195/g.19801 Transcript_9195/m.19801 type:complete len:1228 (+) Transcript_9195:94-3777(+)
MERLLDHDPQSSNYFHDDAYYDDYFWESDITTKDAGNIPLYISVAISTLLIMILPWLVSSDIINRKLLACFPSLAWDEDDEDEKNKDLTERSWKHLPRGAKKAARRLGYNARLWDRDIVPKMLEEKSWKDLSKKQQESAEFLGYDQEQWDDEFPEEYDSVSDPSTSSSESNYNDYDWEELSPKLRDAAMNLGYTQQMWDAAEDEPTICKEKSWDELSPAQQESARLLGYTRFAWDEVEKSISESDRDEEESLESAKVWLATDVDLATAPNNNETITAPDEKVRKGFSNVDWTDLPEEVRKAATSLGYTESKWMLGVDPSVCSNCDWVTLTTDQKESAAILGYITKEEWDGRDEKIKTADVDDESERVEDNNALDLARSSTIPTSNTSGKAQISEEQDPVDALVAALDGIAPEPARNVEGSLGDNQSVIESLFDEPVDDEDNDSSFLTMGSAKQDTSCSSDLHVLDPEITPPRAQTNSSPYVERTTVADEKAGVSGGSSTVSSLFEYDEASISKNPLLARANRNIKDDSKDKMVIPWFVNKDQELATDPISTLKIALSKYEDEESSVSTYQTLTSAMTGVFAAAMQGGARTRGHRAHRLIRQNLKKQVRTEEILRAGTEAAELELRESSSFAGFAMADERSIRTFGAQSAPTMVGMGKDTQQAYRGIPVDLRVTPVVDVDNDDDLTFTSRPAGGGKDANDDDDDDDLEQYKGDDCCRTALWCRPRVLGRGIRKLIKISKCDSEAKEIFKLGFPFLFMSIFGGALSVGVMALVGKQLGSGDLSVFVVTESLLGITDGLFAGFTESLMTICSHARGADKKALVGEYIQIAFLLWLVGFIPHCAFWSIYTEPMMRLFGFDEEIAQAAVSYVRIGLLGDLIGEAASCLHTIFYVEDYVMLSTVIELVDSIYYLVAVVIAFLFFEPSLNDLAWIYNGIALLFLIVPLVVISHSGWFTEYLPGLFKTFGLRNWNAVKVVVRTSVPLSVGYLLSYGEWEILVFLAGVLGPAEVSVWGILGYIWEVMEGISLAIGDSAEVRCAYWLGAGKPSMARYSVYKSIWMGMLSAILFSIAIYVLRSEIPTWLTNDPLLRDMIESSMALVALGNATMSFGSLAWTVVGSQGRYRLATTNVFIGNYLITLPAAVLCVVKYNLSLEALVATVVVGYMFSGTLNSVVMLNSDWKQISEDVIEEAQQAAGAIVNNQDAQGQNLDSANAANSDSLRPGPKIHNIYSF